MAVKPVPDRLKQVYDILKGNTNVPVKKEEEVNDDNKEE